jgi:hypothetical protein
MTATRCTCGYEADSPEEFTDHIEELFIPDSDMAPDGQVHAEAAAPVPLRSSDRRECLCGFTGTATDLDGHFLRAFLPADRTSPDGAQHVPEWLAAS